MARDSHGRPPTTQATPPRASSTSMRAAQVQSPAPPRFPLRPPSPASSASKYSDDDDEDESVYCAPGAPTTVRRQPALHYPNSASTPPLNIRQREPPLGTPLARANTDPRRDAASTRARLAAAHRPTASDVTPPRSAPPNRRPTAYGAKASGAARLWRCRRRSPARSRNASPWSITTCYPSASVRGPPC
ncbi:hypothetical protein A0H81_11939 [Grifola frondosa]|uniref:Uncharacterized protein n=1 Tax=Grifola frondosa TaxID=5627 RepID=A0A1C7LZQ0_GRIFR|nr:hypothetical protein A0H81_11939 [Grifola frondosa]